jgi:HEAT repeat protein
MMDFSVESFLELSPTRQIESLKEGELSQVPRDQMIIFLKSALDVGLPSKTTACALKILRELKYRDQFFFRKFLYHADSSVANAARKAISEAIEQKDSGIIRITEMLKKEKGPSRMEYLDSILQEKIDFSTEILISLLNLDDSHIRQKLVHEINRDYHVDEPRLVDAIKGAVWFVRASIVKILSNRDSEFMLEVIDYLMNDRNVEVKLSMIEALCRLDPTQSRAYLVRLTRDPLVWVKKQAEKALSSLADSRE